MSELMDDAPKTCPIAKPSEKHMTKNRQFQGIPGIERTKGGGSGLSGIPEDEVRGRKILCFQPEAMTEEKAGRSRFSRLTLRE
jgi:hypothetical protein